MTTTTATELLGNLEGYKLLVLSTGHLTAATAKLLTNDPKDCGTLVAPFEEGFFVSASHAPDPQRGPAEYLSLWTVCEFARKQGYQYLLLDRDGDRISELPDYEW
jgi:hypothetical protein